MAEAWDDESIFKQGLEAGHGVDLQTSTTRFFSTTNGVPTTDCKLFECSGGGADVIPVSRCDVGDAEAEPA